MGALQLPSVEEVEHLLEVVVRNVREDEREGGLVTAPALTACQGAEQSGEQLGLGEDQTVDRYGDPLLAVQDDVSPSLSADGLMKARHNGSRTIAPHHSRL